MCWGGLRAVSKSVVKQNFCETSNGVMGWNSYVVSPYPAVPEDMTLFRIRVIADVKTTKPQGECHLPAKKGTWNRAFPHRPQEKTTIPISGYQTSSFHNCDTINFSCLNHPVCGTFLWHFLANNTSSLGWASPVKRSYHLILKVVLWVRHWCNHSSMKIWNLKRLTNLPEEILLLRSRNTS